MRWIILGLLLLLIGLSFGSELVGWIGLAFILTPFIFFLGIIGIIGLFGLAFLLCLYLMANDDQDRIQ